MVVLVNWISQLPGVIIPIARNLVRFHRLSTLVLTIFKLNNLVTLAVAALLYVLDRLVTFH